MAPVATNVNSADRVAELKKQANGTQLINPFYSPNADSAAEDDYKYAAYKVRSILSGLTMNEDEHVLQPHFPAIDWEPLEEVEVKDRGHFADPEKKALFSAAKKVQHLTPVIGTEITGIDLRQLTSAQKDELFVPPAVSLRDRTDGVSTVLSWLPREASCVRRKRNPNLGCANPATVFRDQELNIHEQLDIARHFGPLHKHATTPVPKEPGLEEVHSQS